MTYKNKGFQDALQDEFEMISTNLFAIKLFMVIIRCMP